MSPVEAPAYLGRVSYVHTAKVAQIAAQRRLEATEPVSLGDTVGGPIRAILGPVADTLKPCSAGCSALMVRFVDWEKLDKPKRKRLMHLGVKRIQSYGRCWGCTEAGKPAHGNAPKNSYARKITAETLEKLPEIWREVQDAGGGQQQLADRLGVSRERARQLISKHNLPRRDGRVERSLHFLEELEHLDGLGMGVGYIARALGMTPEGLVKKVDHLHYLGKTAVKFTGWQHRYAKDNKEEAA